MKLSDQFSDKHNRLRPHTIYTWTVSNFQVTIKEITQSIISNEIKPEWIDHKDVVGVFNKIWAALSEIKEIDDLLSLIVDELLSLIWCDACSIYIREYNPDKLNFKIAKTISLNKNSPNSSNFINQSISLEKETIAWYVALTWDIVNEVDCYNISSWVEYKFNDSFDKLNWYKTTSMIVVPLKTKDGTIVWVLQLINKLWNNWDVIPFSKQYEDIISSIASQVAISIENMRLFEQLRELIHSLVDSLSEAIDSRSRQTAGHSSRVADISLLIVNAINEANEWPFKEVFFSKMETLVVEYAAKLHDVGKISVPESILDKGSKLPEWKIDIIKERFQVIKYYYKFKGLKDFSDIDWDYEFIEKINKASFTSTEDLNRLNNIRLKEYTDPQWIIQNYITKDELDYLSIIRGNLSQDERDRMNYHIVDTKKILKPIIFPKWMENVPVISWDHHEKLNWEGYPLGKKWDEISLPARILAIADIFEALTAPDRPYKEPTPLDIALNILKKEVENWVLDKDIIDLFIENKLYEKYIVAINNTI